MNLSLSLSELNELYYAMSVFTKQAEKDAKDFPSEFFSKQLETAKSLTEKVQTALWDEVKQVDEAIDYIRNKRKEYEETR